MAIENIDNKHVGFVSTKTNNQLDLPVSILNYKNTGYIIVSYSDNDIPHIWLGGNHLASGYGQDTTKDKINLSYISNSYNVIWNYIENLNLANPFTLNKDNTNAVFKNTNSYSFSNSTLIVGDNNLINENSTGSVLIGLNNKLEGENTLVSGKNNKIIGNNVFASGEGIRTYTNNQYIIGNYPKVTSDTLFALGGGSNSSSYNILEVTKNGDLYIKGIGKNNNDSFQSYISKSLSYNTNFTQNYTYDNIQNIVNGAYYNTLKKLEDKINNDFSYTLNNLNNINTTYVTNTGDERSNIGYTWVPSLGKELTLDMILSSLLIKPKYTKPELNIICNTYYEVGSYLDSDIEFDFGDTLIDPRLNINKGYSYSYYKDNKLWGIGIEFETYNGTLIELNNNITNNKVENYINNTYNLNLGDFKLNDCDDYEIIKNIKYYYNNCTYMFFPQLLENSNPKELVCYNGWYETGYSELENNVIIKSRYKYYYGWDIENIPTILSNTENLTSLSTGIDWLEKDEVTQIKISFEENHNLFWIAYPINYDHININNFRILYKTFIGEQDLISNSVLYKTLVTQNNIGNADIKYKIEIVYFNRNYYGEEGNYIKLNLTRNGI